MRAPRKWSLPPGSAALDAGGDYADMAADVVVIGRREALSADYAALVEDLRRALRAVTRPKPTRPDGIRHPSIGDRRRGPS